MKKLTYILILAIAAPFFISCEKDEVQAVLSDNPEAPELLNPSAENDLEFTKEDADEAIDFEWSKAEFGFQASVDYHVEIATTSSFEESSVMISSNNKLNGSAVVKDINSVLLSLGIPVGESTPIKCRVYATVNSKVAPAYSEIKEFTATPYETLIDYPLIYVPGAYQGWSPGADNGRLYSYDFNSVYEGIIRISETTDGNGKFKVTPEANWDNAWGGVLTKTGDDYTGTMDASGADFEVVPSTYEFTVNTESLTIEMTKTDDWGIIGGSVPPYDWSVDVDMDYDGQRQVWHITGEFNVGDFKFRANDAWDLNYGGADGVLVGGGDNIPITEEGNYTIQLDLVNNSYSIVKN